MSYYGVAFSRYWTGPTGRALRRRGGKDTQLLGAYLLFNDHMNMLGLYELRPRDIREDLGLMPAAVAKAFEVMADEEYAFYDIASAFVWVREMARFRLNIKDEQPLDRSDNKVKGARRLYESFLPNPWLGPFFDRYGKIIHLKQRRTYIPQDIAPLKGMPSDFEGASKGLQRGFEASNQIRLRDQDQKDKSSGGRPPRSAPVENPTQNIGVITKIAHEVIDQIGAEHPEIVESIKCLCATRGITYNSAVVLSAIKSARVQKAVKAS